MEYTIKKLASMSGVSTRTLRYYDEIDLLKPARINSSGYRIYGETQVNLLQQILFYREMGVELAEIRNILTSKDFNFESALAIHLEKLIEKRVKIDKLIANVNKTLAHEKGEIFMLDKEKFEGFKQEIIDENERKYGAEIREKYGEDAVMKSNYKVKNMTQHEFEELTALNDKLNKTLADAFDTGDPSSETAQMAAELHRRWLCYYWDHYSKEAHAGLAQMYVDDPRFTEYYDKIKVGLAPFLRDAIFIYTQTIRPDEAD